MRVLVCGGRDFVAVLHGGCRGADEWAGRVADRLGIPVRVFPADWAQYGRAAGPIRNRQMLDEADAVIAFPGSAGTADAIEEARRRGIPVIVVLR